MNELIQANLVVLISILILQLIFTVYCIFIIAKNPVKYLPKWVWIILSFNTLGAIIFLLIGKDK